MLETEQQAVNCKGCNLQCNFVTMTSKIQDFSEHIRQTKKSLNFYQRYHNINFLKHKDKIISSQRTFYGLLKSCLLILVEKIANWIIRYTII